MPAFEKVARASARSVAATVTTSGTRAGDPSHASVAVFPAADTYVIPVAIDRRTAASSASDAGDVALTVATRGVDRVRGDPVETGEQLSDGPGPRAVEHAHRHQRDRGRAATGRAADRAGDVGPVVIAVVADARCGDHVGTK